jgi:hypothetical protein
MQLCVSHPQEESDIVTLYAMSTVYEYHLKKNFKGEMFQEIQNSVGNFKCRELSNE